MKRAERRDLTIKIFAGVMAFVMIAGTIAGVLVYLL